MIKCEICDKILSLTSWNFNNSGEHRKTKDGKWVCSEKHLIEYNKIKLQYQEFTNSYDKSINKTQDIHQRDIEKEIELEKIKHQQDIERRERFKREDKEFFEGIQKGVITVFSFVKKWFSK